MREEKNSNSSSTRANIRIAYEGEKCCSSQHYIVHISRKRTRRKPKCIRLDFFIYDALFFFSSLLFSFSATSTQFFFMFDRYCHCSSVSFWYMGVFCCERQFTGMYLIDYEAIPIYENR